jgi:phosphoglycolate/pyridoxal phosphate phosphatase family enzyme
VEKKVRILNKQTRNKIKAVVFDLDGTIYFGNTLATGSRELIDYLKNINIGVFYFTNNSIKSREDIFLKLKNLGLKLSLDEVYNSSYAAAVYIKENAIKQVYCVGSKGLVHELESNGIVVLSNGEDVDAVVVGLDTGFNYDNIAKALNCLQKGCKLIACNRDRNYPIENNRLLPGCGPLVAAIEYAACRQADYVIGKPNTYILKLLTREHGLKNDEIMIVGDNYESDIMMAKSYGSPSVLIADGFASDFKDTVVVKKINELKPLFLNERRKGG